MDSVAEVNVYSNVSVWSGIDSFKMDLKHLHEVFESSIHFFLYHRQGDCLSEICHTTVLKKI